LAPLEPREVYIGRHVCPPSEKIPTARAKKFTGHETDSVFQRYAIADETSLREAGEKYAEQLGEMNAAPARRVVEIS